MMIKAFFRHILQLIFLIVFLGAASIVLADKEYEVVIHPQVNDKNLSLNTLRAIFGMRMQTWSDGTRIRVFVLADDAPLHQQFSKGTLNVFPYQLRSAWDRLVFSGIGQAPVKVSSIEEMLVKVASTPGSIGYLWRANVDGSVDVLQVKK
jgi:ABC-type phosphate transport system substrate-binding protein